MSDHQADYPIATMCQLLGVSPSGYYAWRKRQPSPRSETDVALIAEIQVAHAGSRGTYGAPRIHAELAAKRRKTIDEAKLRWLFDHREEIRAETARWRLLLRIDSNRAMNFNIADSDSIYFFISSAALAERDFSRMEAGFTQG